MQALHDRMAQQFEECLVEPTSGLGQAITYPRNHWEKLNLFLRVPWVRLSNNHCERALKKAILHRKNSHFTRTLNGAQDGDRFISLILTAALHQIDPLDYLVTPLRHAGAVALDPTAWMPRNCTAAFVRLAVEVTDPPRRIESGPTDRRCPSAKVQTTTIAAPLVRTRWRRVV